MDVIKTISKTCGKSKTCLRCEFRDTYSCLFESSPLAWDTAKIWEALNKSGYISDSVELLSGLKKQLEAMEPEVNVMDPNAWEVYDRVLEMLNNCLKVG